ncbi:MAG: hypothetical protein LBS12_03720 [Prevotellaceae bacterium]|jgi:UDP-N-acetylmuramyl pentapeptide phosphotransferase/UDP-N-acetylglucosamine-1-phosphate transferase|nr:hypothetical protein [Prevotellaceae bacterium]
MNTATKKKIKAGGTIILNGIALLSAVLYVLIRKVAWFTQTVPDWLKFDARDIIMIIVILYALLRMWTDDFLKKPWLKKDYMPLAIMLIIIMIYFL